MAELKNFTLQGCSHTVSQIFKILSLPYRNRRRRFGLRCNLIAAIYNFEVSLPASKNCSPLS